MADLHRMERTWLCSVFFTDIAGYSSQSVEQQMKWKARFNGYLTTAIHEVPEDERVILDTGDGAAICFLGAPEAAMFAALELWHSLLLDEREQQPPLRVRIGINLGPVRLVKDINGALNAIGDGINAGQRIMSFAAENQILVSQSFYDVVSRLSDDYKALFSLKGIETDKHVREHTVYHLAPPGSDKSQSSVTAASQGHVPDPAWATTQTSLLAERLPESKTVARSRAIPILIFGIVLAVIAADGAWRFFRPNVKDIPVGQGQMTQTSPAAAPMASAPSVQAPSPPIASSVPPVASAPRPKETPPTALPSKSIPPATAADAKAAYDQGMRLLNDYRPGPNADDAKAAEAARHLSDAIRADPDYLEAYVGRAQARRLLGQYDQSIEDCNRIMKINPSEPRGYNCRGHGYLLLMKYNEALRDLNEAIRLNPNFGSAFENRANAYSALNQHQNAIQDYTEALRVRPNEGEFYVKRAVAYTALKDYHKAAQDYTEAIRLLSNNLRAYNGRASVEDLLGETAAANADRRFIRESRKERRSGAPKN